MQTVPESSSGTHDLIGIVRRRLMYFVFITPPIVLLAVFFAFWLKPRYQATATILLELSSVPTNVVQTTVVSYSDQQIEIVQGRVMTLDTLKHLVEEFDPYPENTSSVIAKAQRVLESTTLEKVDPVSMKPVSDESNAFSLHYINPDRERAAAVAQRLAQLFLTYYQRTRTESAHDAAVFLQQQAEVVVGQMREVEDELAKLKGVQGDALPELREQNQGALERTERELDALQQEILTAEAKESQLSEELGQTSPNLMTHAGEFSDVATVRANLAEAEQRYTPDHPEVKRLKQALQTLMAQNSAAPSKGGISTTADNPQYVMTATELESARRELSALRAQEVRYKEKLNSYEELLRRTPSVERTYSEIMRRRQSLQTDYQQIQDKLQNAQVAQNFEAEQRGERFVMLRAPSPPRSPVYPNRIGLISMGLLLGLGIAAVIVAIVETIDSRIRDAYDIPQITDAPLLASIPRIRNPSDRMRRRLLYGTLGLTYGGAIVFVVMVVASALRY